MFLTSCDPQILEVIDGLGWIGADEENLEEIEDDISFGSGTPPASYSLLNRFPPIGNQGAYGTCVAWAVGYNHRSYINALENGYTTSDMNSSSKVFSPKYLFWAVPSSKKGSDCNGTGFEAAYDVMLSSGIATLSETPYTDLGDCSGSTSSWDSEASDHKMQSYREITLDALTIKQYLSNNRAVSFGAKLGENFMSYNSSDVLYDDTDTYNGQHAYHAMILSGYDDNMGSNGAFRIVNSWGTNWGDGGYIWVDQNFFINDFAFCAFVGTSNTDPDGDDNNQVDDPTEGKDLIGWELNDLDNGGGTSRIAKYNVFNSGTEEIYATEHWNIIYLVYNAYDANDFDILLYDYYTNEYGDYGDDGELSDGDGTENWWNYINVPSGQSVAQALYGGEDSRFSWPYEMPTTVTGEYYLVLIADGYNVLAEANEDNNYFFLTDVNGEPITITNGVIQEELASSSKSNWQRPKHFDDSPMPTTVSNVNMNAYTPGEILTMIEHRKATGEIARKAAMYQNKNSHAKKRY